ncbi:hypothetical protein BDQ17DRAFT_1536694 [Cyathus striatus]|nr:hypothetical protein BDQ17DRAFT_1536694 [Cyathus striatus]
MDGNNLSFRWFGQVFASGTHYGTRGNIRGDETIIIDDANVKDMIALESPSLAPPKLIAAFNNQITTINKIITQETKQMVAPEITYCITKKDSSNAYNLLHFVSEPKYRTPQTSNKGLVPKKRDLQELNDANLENISSTTSEQNFQLPDDFFKLSIFHDVNSNNIQLQKNKLYCLPYHDTEDNKIHPTDVCSELQQGTFIIIDSFLLIWMPSPNKKVFQLQIKKLHVVVPSNLPIDTTVPKLTNSTVPVTTQPPPAKMTTSNPPHSVITTEPTYNFTSFQPQKPALISMSTETASTSRSCIPTANASTSKTPSAIAKAEPAAKRNRTSHTANENTKNNVSQISLLLLSFLSNFLTFLLQI